MQESFLEEMRETGDVCRFRIEYNVQGDFPEKAGDWDMSAGVHSLEMESGFKDAWAKYEEIRNCPGCSVVRIALFTGYAYEDCAPDYA